MNSAEFFIKRNAMGWSVPHAAKMFNVERRTVQRWEAGKHPVPLNVSVELEEYWQDWIEKLDNLVADADAIAPEGEEIALTAYRDQELAAKNSALAVLLELADRGFIAEWAEEE